MNNDYLVYGLILLLLLISLLSHLGIYTPTFLTGFATVLLVIANLISLEQNRELIRETRNERKRPYIKKVIVSLIDATTELLKKHEHRWENSCNPCGERSYPEFTSKHLPQEHLTDIKRDNSELGNQLVAYFEKHDEYESLWREIRDDLEAYIQSDFRLDAFPNCVGEVVPERYHETERTSALDASVSSLKLLEKEADLFAIDVLLNTSEDLDDVDSITNYDYVEFFFDQFREEFLSLRRHDRFEERFERLRDKLEEIEDLNGEIKKGLHESREEYIEEYEIMETELREIDDESMDIM